MSPVRDRGEATCDQPATPGHKGEGEGGAAGYAQGCNRGSRRLERPVVLTVRSEVMTSGDIREEESRDTQGSESQDRMSSNIANGDR
jgi:hypothetical protein